MITKAILSINPNATFSVEDNDTFGYISAENGRLSLGGLTGLNADNLNIMTASGYVGIGTNNPSAKLDVDGTLQTKEQLLSAISKDISTTALDVFVYDTSRDTDGGAWTYRTENTSWYNETFGAKRGSKKEFPAVAVIQCSSNDLYIYDADDPEMPLWMHFDQSGGNDMINTYGGDSLQNPTMFNGHLAVCNAAYDLWRVDFIKDIAFLQSCLLVVNVRSVFFPSVDIF